MVSEIDVENLHRIVVTCVIYKKPRFGKTLYLIKQRSFSGGGPYPGRWEVVGGGVHRSDYTLVPKTNEDGWEFEVLHAAVDREVYEETGLRVGAKTFLGIFSFIRESDGVSVFGARFAAPYVSGEVHLDADALQYRWVTAREVVPYNPIGTIACDISSVEIAQKPLLLRPAYRFISRARKRVLPRAAYF